MPREKRYVISITIIFLISTLYTIEVEGFYHHQSNKVYTPNNHVVFGRQGRNQPWGGHRRREHAHYRMMNLVPEDNQSIDPNRLSVSKVPYKTVLSGLKQLYPPQDLSERNAISRTDGYWAFIKNGEEIPQGLTYGEFDFLFFSELLDLAHHHYFDGEGQTNNGWDGKVFVDIGSGTGRLVIGAAALHPGFAKCKGLEILNGIHETALQNLNECKKYYELDDSGPVSDISRLDCNTEEEEDISGELTTVVEEDERNDAEAEPLTSEMVELQKALQQMTAQEWQDMMGEHVIDDDSVADVYIEDLKDETDGDDSIIAESNVSEEEDEDDFEEVTEEETSEDPKERNVPYAIHPEYSIPSEDELTTIYETDENEIIMEHKFDSLGEFECLSIEEWKLIYEDNAVETGAFTTTLSPPTETKSMLQTGTKEESSKNDGNNEYVLRSPLNSGIVISTNDGMNDLPLAPIEFLCGSFEDPYQYIGDADVAFVFSTCMTKDLMGSLSRAFGRQCKPGTIIITTDFKLHLDGYIDPVEDDPNLPFGEFKFEVLEKVDGYCWLLGGESTAYIHRVINSLWVDIDEDGDSIEKPKPSVEEEARRIIDAMEANTLTNTTTFVRSMQNSMAFHLFDQHFFDQVETNTRTNEEYPMNTTESNI